MILTAGTSASANARRHFTRLSFRCLATHAPDFRIPVIDFSKYQSAASSSQKQETADAIVSAFKGAGFVYLSNHGIPDHTVKHVFSKVRTSIV